MTQINIEKEKESAINAKNIVMEYLQACGTSGLSNRSEAI